MYDTALEWFETERVNLVAACQRAYDTNKDLVTWQLAVSLWDFFNLRKHWSDWIYTGELGLAAAKRMGHRHGEGLVLNTLGNAYADLREFQRAIDCYLQALAIVRYVGDQWSEAWILNNLGRSHLGLRDTDEAIRYLRRALQLRQQVGDIWGEGWTLAYLGDVNRASKRHDLAEQYYEKALNNRMEIRDPIGEGYLHHRLGSLYQDLGQYDDSVLSYESALAIQQQHGDRWGEAVTLSEAGLSYLALGRLDEAAECCQRAREIFQSLGDWWGAASALRRLGNVRLKRDGLDAARETWREAHQVSGAVGDYDDNLPLLELPERIPKLWVDDDAEVKVGQATSVWFAYVNPYGRGDAARRTTSSSNSSDIFIRVLLNTFPDADIEPVTVRVPLSNDRTSTPARFAVTPRSEGVLQLRVSVYADRTGELLQEVASTLLATSEGRVA